jgi:hypothetical protein
VTVAVSPFLDAFAAEGPAPGMADKLALFGRLVGSWDLAVTTIDAAGEATTVPGEWHFGWALAGRAVADVWICPPRTDTGESPGEHGLSLRFYDDALGAWRSTWMGPARGLVVTFVARPQGDDGIVLEGHSAGVDRRWSFSDITPTSFRWRNEESVDGGAHWRLVQTFDARRA